MILAPDCMRSQQWLNWADFVLWRTRTNTAHTRQSTSQWTLMMAAHGRKADMCHSPKLWVIHSNNRLKFTFVHRNICIWTSRLHQEDKSFSFCFWRVFVVLPENSDKWWSASSMVAGTGLSLYSNFIHKRNIKWLQLDRHEMCFQCPQKI